MYSYQLMRSKRRTVSLEITKELTVLVRAPLLFSKARIDQFVLEREGWIEKHLALIAERNRAEAAHEPTQEQQAELKKLAKELLPRKTEYYANLMGLHPTGIKITSAKKRFGSCSGKNGICYSYHLMRYPDAAIDYVVVHELAHIKHKNHGKHFYVLIEKHLPDYKERRALLHKLPADLNDDSKCFCAEA